MISVTRMIHTGHVLLTQIASTFRFLLLCGLVISLIGTCGTTCSAGMPQLNDKELAEFEKFMQELEKPEMQQLIKEFEEEFNKLPPEVQEDLNKKAMEDLKRMGIDPYAYAPPETSPIPQPKPTPYNQQKIQPPTPQISQETVSDYSLVTTHSPQQASCLLQNTVSYLEIVRQKLTLLNIDSRTAQEWLNTLAHYLKMINKPEHVKRLISITFTHVFDLITELEALLRAEASSLIILNGEEESRSDDPYAILGIPYDATWEEIKKAYEQKMTQHDPVALEKELKQTHTDPIKIKKRTRQAAARQATLIDAYYQLEDPNARQQLDRYRTHTQTQQLSLRSANRESIERLKSTLNTLVQQGLITKLEDFFARYTPTELTYHQTMEEAEQNRFSEQRSTPTISPMPSPLNGGFPFGGYQPQSYYPGNSYYPNNNYFQPNFTPPPSGNTVGKPGAPGGSAAPAPQSVEGNKAKGEKEVKDNTPKKSELKKTDEKKNPEGEKKKKKKGNGAAVLKKDFAKCLDELKEPLIKFKTYMEADEQDNVRSQLTALEEPRIRAGTLITDDSFKALHEGLKKHICADFMKKIAVLQKFIGERLMKDKQPHQKALDVCRSTWEAHRKSHAVAYETLELLCKHVIEAYHKNPRIAEQIPWNNVLEVCSTVGVLQQLFQKPGSENNKTSHKPDKQPSFTTQREQKTQEEKAKKETVAPLALQDAKNLALQIKPEYDETERALRNINNLEKILTEVNEALEKKDLSAIFSTYATLNNALTSIPQFSHIEALLKDIKKVRKFLSESDKKEFSAFIRQAKLTKHEYPLTYAVNSIKKKIKQLNRKAAPSATTPVDLNPA